MNNTVRGFFYTVLLHTACLIVSGAVMPPHVLAAEKNQILKSSPSVYDTSKQKSTLQTKQVPAASQSKTAPTTKPYSNPVTKHVPISKTPTKSPTVTPYAQPITKKQLQPAKGLSKTPSSVTYTAILQSTARRQGRIMSKGVPWNCKGNRCTVIATWSQPAVKHCNDLVRIVGRVRNYGRQGKVLNVNQLNSCNKGAPVAKSNQSGFSTATKQAKKTPVKMPQQKKNDTTSINSLKQPNKFNKGSATTGLSASKSTNYKGIQKSSNDKATTNKQTGGFSRTKPVSGSSTAGVATAGKTAFTGIGRDLTVQKKTLSQQQLRYINQRQNSFQLLDSNIQANNAATMRLHTQWKMKKYPSGTDCNDNDAEIHPDRLEICDHKDNNCNGLVDEGQTIIAYADLDGDGHGDAASRLDVCSSDIREAQERGEWLITIGNDCDDTDPDRWHGCP